MNLSFFLQSEKEWNVDPKHKETPSPAVNLIIQYSHAEYSPNLDKSIIIALLNSYKDTKKRFSHIFQE